MYKTAFVVEVFAKICDFRFKNQVLPTIFAKNIYAIAPIFKFAINRLKQKTSLLPSNDAFLYTIMIKVILLHRQVFDCIALI